MDSKRRFEIYLYPEEIADLEKILQNRLTEDTIVGILLQTASTYKYVNQLTNLVLENRSKFNLLWGNSILETLLAWVKEKLELEKEK